MFDGLYIPTSHAGILYHYTHNLVAFEHAPPSGLNASTPAEHTLLFIPGLYGSLLNVHYSTPLAAALPFSWRLVQPQLSSAAQQFGMGSIAQDVRDLALCLTYIRQLRPHGKVVLMGHSTGCQDAMHYLLSELGDGEARQPIQGLVLQGSCSDREFAAMHDRERVESAIKVAAQWVKEGKGEEVLPQSVVEGLFYVPVCARRCLSMLSSDPVHDGGDEYFSSDLDDQRLMSTFGKIGVTGARLLILFSEKDECVPDFVDKEELVRKWSRMTESGSGIVDEGTGVVKGANHDYSNVNETVLQDMISRVTSFVSKVEKEVHHSHVATI